MGIKDTFKRLEALAPHREFRLPVVENINGEYYLVLSHNSNTPDDIRYAVYNPATDKEITLEHYTKLLEGCATTAEKTALHAYLQNMIIDTKTNLSLSQIATNISNPNTYVDNSRLRHSRISAKTYLNGLGKLARDVESSEDEEETTFSQSIGTSRIYTMPILLDGHIFDMEKADYTTSTDGEYVITNGVKRTQNKLYLPPAGFVTIDRAQRLNEAVLEAIEKISDPAERKIASDKYAEIQKRNTAITKVYRGETTVANKDTLPSTMTTSADLASDIIRFTAPTPKAPTTSKPRSRKATEIISHIKGKYTIETNGQVIEGDQATLRIKGDEPFTYEIIK